MAREGYTVGLTVLGIEGASPAEPQSAKRMELLKREFRASPMILGRVGQSDAANSGRREPGRPPAGTSPARRWQRAQAP